MFPKFENGFTPGEDIYLESVNPVEKKLYHPTEMKIENAIRARLVGRIADDMALYKDESGNQFSFKRNLDQPKIEALNNRMPIVRVFEECIEVDDNEKIYKVKVNDERLKMSFITDKHCPFEIFWQGKKCAFKVEKIHYILLKDLIRINTEGDFEFNDLRNRGINPGKIEDIYSLEDPTMNVEKKKEYIKMFIETTRDLPPFRFKYVKEPDDPDNNYSSVCLIDGIERFLSVLLFYNGKISLDKSFKELSKEEQEDLLYRQVQITFENENDIPSKFLAPFGIYKSED